MGPATRRVAVALLVVAAVLGTVAVIHRAPASTCSRVAAPGGSDAAPGTAGRPFRTVQRLVDALRPGQTGCLREGTYREDVKVTAGGTAAAPITLTSAAGGGRATLGGRLWVARGADHTVFEHLDLRATRRTTAPSPTVNAGHTTWDDVDVANGHTNICFVLGDADGRYGRADATTIVRSRIHDCGVLPATNRHHGIYVEASTGSTIAGNRIADNADRGIQLYPDARRTTIVDNVVVGNGEGIAFGSVRGLPPPSGNVIRGNVIAGSRRRWNVESFWAGGVGRGNLVAGNCVRAADPGGYYGAGGGIDPRLGVRTAGNLATGAPGAVRACAGALLVAAGLGRR